MGERTSWHEQRQAAIAAHAAEFERKRAAETARARELLAGFVREMFERGIPPVRLRAQVPDSRTSYRTGLTGWYLRRNRSLAVSVDGEFYILDTARSLRARLVGCRLRPTDPPLQVGVGARDGESISLAQLLQQRISLGGS